MAVTFRHHRLPNGLTILAEVDPDAHSAACGFFVRTGARDEDTPVMGVSHFLEHMMFKGTQAISARELNVRFDAMGARNNAYTSNELTCFYAHVLPERLRDAVELLSLMLRPALRDEDFTTEKGVILEEIAMYKDNPFSDLYDRCLERYYGNHPLAHRVLGTTQSITDLTRDQMARYFDDRYTASCTVVALAGRLDWNEVVRWLEDWCASWPAGLGPRTRVGPGTMGEGVFEDRDPKISRGYLLGICPAPGAQDERRYAAGMLAQILGAPGNSRLHWGLVESGLAEQAQAGHDAHEGVGEFMVYAAGEPARMPEIMGRIERELGSLVPSLTADDLERLRNRALTAATLGGERPADRMQRLGRLWTTLGEHRPLEEELERLNRVTLGDLRAVHEAFPLRPRVTSVLKP